jgi:hypothetical protein
MKSLGSYTIPEEGTVWIVANPEECSDFKHLMRRLDIDGVEREISAVEFRPHGKPWQKGEPIGLLERI